MDGGNHEEFGEKTVRSPFCLPKYHIERPGTEIDPPRCESMADIISRSNSCRILDEITTVIMEMRFH
jgi:hypothetical protein